MKEAIVLGRTFIILLNGWIISPSPQRSQHKKKRQFFSKISNRDFTWKLLTYLTETKKYNYWRFFRRQYHLKFLEAKRELCRSAIPDKGWRIDQLKRIINNIKENKNFNYRNIWKRENRITKRSETRIYSLKNENRLVILLMNLKFCSYRL